MIISHAYTELKRRAKEGCLDSMLDLVDCYGQGKLGIEQSDELYLQKSIALLDKIDEFRESKYSTAHIFYEIMYAYLEQGNDAMGDHYHHLLMWEIALNHPNGDLEPHFEHYQIREFAEYLDKDVETILDQVKAWHQQYDLKTYKTLSVNHFFTN